MTTATNYIAIIGALDAEIEEYKHHITEIEQVAWHEFVFYTGLWHGKKVVLVKSGVGKVFAAMITQKVIDTYQPECILFTGVAGGLNTSYEVGDVIIARDCIQHDMDATELGFSRGTIPYTKYRFFESDAALKKLALATPMEHTLHEGRIVTGDQFLTKKELLAFDYLTKELGGDAVEMEGAAVGQVCTVNQVPFLIIRTISDKADENATLSFTEFLPTVAKNSFHVVSHVLKLKAILNTI